MSIGYSQANSIASTVTDLELTMGGEDTDTLLRNAAFERIRRLSEMNNHLRSEDIKAGFNFRGERIPFGHRPRGIFKPRQMRYLLSIKTVIPRPGRRYWYDDQRQVHSQIFESSEAINYSFMGENPEAAPNQWLREAFENQIPIIYFLGIAPGRYQAIFPTFISDWDRNSLNVRLVFGLRQQKELISPRDHLERRYALHEVKSRLHQATFREAVIAAYRGRCAISQFPEQRLIDAAHIISDKNEKLGQPIVPNGLPLSKIHHAAFDSHLIGIDTDYRLHVSERLLHQKDGPILEDLKQLDGKLLHLPVRSDDYPDRDRLALRFEYYKAAA